MFGTRIDTECERQLGVPGGRRLPTRCPHSSRRMIFFNKIEHRKIAKLLGDQLDDFRECLLEIEAGREYLPELGERALLALEALLIGDVADGYGKHPFAIQLQLRDRRISGKLLAILPKTDDVP